MMYNMAMLSSAISAVTYEYYVFIDDPLGAHSIINLEKFNQEHILFLNILSNKSISIIVCTTLKNRLGHPNIVFNE